VTSVLPVSAIEIARPQAGRLSRFFALLGDCRAISSLRSGAQA